MKGFLLRFVWRETCRKALGCGRSLRDDWVWIGRAIDQAREEKRRG
jgi:hypothetical protein